MPPDPPPTFFERYHRLLLLVILLLALGFRTRGLNWDESRLLHPDERFLTQVTSQLRLPDSLAEYFDTASSPLNPYNHEIEWYVYGTTPLFLLRFVAEMSGLTGHESLALLGRSLSSLADLVVVAMTFAIGRRLYGTQAGLLAALLYALAALPIKQSHYFTVDTFAGVPLLLGFWFTLDVMDGRGGLRAYLLSGLCLGLMLASRINLFPFFGIVALAAVLHRARSSGAARPEVRKVPVPQAMLGPVALGMLLALVAAALSFRIAQPYAFEGLFRLNPEYLADMKEVQEIVAGERDYPPSHQWAGRTPFAFPWYNMVVWGLGPALGLTAWAGAALAMHRALRRREWQHLPALFWVLGMFLYHGQQLVVTMRYFLPLYPFLAMFAAFFLTQVDRHPRLARRRRFPVPALAGLVVALTLFWALASTSVYARTQTRLEASRWIFANVAGDEVIASEHWDDQLPLRIDGRDYYADHPEVILELYAEDTPEKRQKMVAWLDEADYIVLSSNRLYGSIKRLPVRYPLTSKYYDWLFSGELGFEPVAEFTSYPAFLGITINDDLAEEAFSVYDHPRVTIFRKTPSYSHGNTLARLSSVDLSSALPLRPVQADASGRQFRQDPQALAANLAGGTWHEIFDPAGFANRFPVLTWLLLICLTGLLAFPYAFVIFRGFADRGYAFARALGLLFIAWLPWTLGSYRILPFGRPAIMLGLLGLAVGGVLIGRSRWPEMRAWLWASRTILLVEELLFFGLFTLDLAIRSANPDLWHPWLGGERPMDFAFLNAIVRTTYFPPYNPWFSGNYINYYYFGQLISAVLIRLTGIVPEVAYNLLLPLFFALSGVGVYGVVFNTVVLGKQRSRPVAAQTGPPGTGAATAAGLLGMVLVLLLGNLAQLRLIVQNLVQLGGGAGGLALLNGLRKWIAGGEALPVRIGDWYWTATRVIPETINEFPFFSFLYGDLHAHLMAIPFALVLLGLATHLLLSRDSPGWRDVALMALLLGTLRATNTWDYPTYLTLAGAAIVLKGSTAGEPPGEREATHWRRWLRAWPSLMTRLLVQVVLIIVPLRILGIDAGLELTIFLLLVLFGVVLRLARAGPCWDPAGLARGFGWPFLGIVSFSILLFHPYLRDYATGYTSLGLWDAARTSLREYITVHGIFLFLAATLFLIELGRAHRAVYLLAFLAAAAAALALPGLPVLVVALPLLCLGGWILLRRSTPLDVTWTGLLIAAALLLTLAVEVVVLQGDVGRTNTVFKFYLQAWVLFGVAGAAGLGLLLARPAAPAGRLRRGWIQPAWWAAFSLLLLAGLLYPLTAVPAKMDDRFVPGLAPGLNGMSYMQTAIYNEKGMDLELRWDHEAIQWMRRTIHGSPVIMEASTGLYGWGSRYSIYTGLPAVIGWDWHTKQQYSLLPGRLIDERVGLVVDFYNTTDQQEAVSIARRYQVAYVVVGALERAVYEPGGLAKFEQAPALWEPVYRNTEVTVYRVQQDE